jgi:uncharacterized protein DUF695
MAASDTIVCMRLFHRDAPPDQPAAGIARFWTWWSDEGARAVSAAIAERDPARVQQRLSEAVAQVHEGLAWELAAGSRAQHLLVLSPEGDPELRPIAHRWLRSAPPADADWEYAAARQAVAEPEQIMLGIEQVELSFGDIRVGARREGTRVDVDVYHPAFAEVEEPVRRQVAYLALDAALGEDDVEAWVGEVTASAQPPLEGFGLRGLRAVVRDLRDDYLGDDGAPQWVALEAQGVDGPVLAMAQVPLSPVTAPHLDTHVAVLVPYTDLTERGYPGTGSLEPLRALEDHLAARIGDSGRIVAHQSHRGMRVLHIYVDSTTPAVEQMRAAVNAWEQGRIRVQVTADPGWHNVAHLRG